MSKQISSLAIRLGGDVNPLAQAFSKADGMVGRFASKITSLGRSAFAFTGIGAAISTLAGGAGIGLLVKNQLEAIDVSSKLAARLNIATESLVGFEHAANLAGLSNEQLANGLGFLMKNLGKAAEGADETGGAFGELKLNVNELMQLSPDEVFMRVADAIAEIPNPMRRAYMATQIFGKSGQELLPLLKDGSKGLRAATEEAKALGLSFSKIDGERIEEANDSITRFKSTFIGIGRTFAVAIAPFLDQAADKFTEWGKDAVSAVKRVTPSIIEGFSDIVSGIGMAGKSLFAWIGRNKEAVSVGLKFAAVVATLRFGMPLMASAIGAGNGAIAKLIGLFGSANAGLKTMSERFFSTRITSGTFKASLAALGPSLQSLGRTGLLGAAVLTVTAFSAVLVRNITHQESWRDSAFKTARSVGLFKDAVTEFGVALEDMGRAANEIRIVEEKLRGATTLETKIRLQQELNELLHQQVLRMQQIDKLEGAQSLNTPWWTDAIAGIQVAQGNPVGGMMTSVIFSDPVTADAGITDKRLDAFDKKIAEGEKRLEALRAMRDQFQIGSNLDDDFGGATKQLPTPIAPETPAIIDATRSAIDRLTTDTLSGIEASDLFRHSSDALIASFNAGHITAVQFNESVQQLLNGLAANEQKIKTNALDKFNSAMMEIEDQIFALNNTEIDVKVREFARTEGVTEEQVAAYRAGLQKLEAERAKFAKSDAQFNPIESLASSIDTGPALLEFNSAEADLLHAQLAVADERMRSVSPSPPDVAAANPAEQETAQLTSEIKSAITGPKSERAIQEQLLKTSNEMLVQLKSIADRETVEVELIEV